MASGGKFFPPERERKKMRNERDEKAFFLPQIGATLQMKIMHLEGGDKMEEKIALEALKVVPASQLLVPLPVGRSVFCRLKKNPECGTKAGL